MQEVGDGNGKEKGKKNDKGFEVRTKQFALRIIRLYSVLPQSTEAQVIGKQILCSGTSVFLCLECVLHRNYALAFFFSLYPLPPKEVRKTALPKT